MGMWAPPHHLLNLNLHLLLLLLLLLELHRQV
jgi:hypothetical protein